MQKAANSCLSIRCGNMSCLLSSKQGVDAVIKKESLDDEAGGLNMLQLQYSLHGRVFQSDCWFNNSVSGTRRYSDAYPLCVRKTTGVRPAN